MLDVFRLRIGRAFPADDEDDALTRAAHLLVYEIGSYVMAEAARARREVRTEGEFQSALRDATKAGLRKAEEQASFCNLRSRVSRLPRDEALELFDEEMLEAVEAEGGDLV